MASKITTPIALFLALNLLFFSYGSAQAVSPSTATCPMDAVKLGVCANLLDGLLGVIIGKPPVQPCCSLIQGLVDLEAAVCLCTALKAGVLGVNIDIPISISLLLNACGKQVPSGWHCA